MALILPYLGGLIAIGVMTLSINVGWEVFGGWGLFFIALGYAVVPVIVCDLFYRVL